jgi:hypothetical protein
MSAYINVIQKGTPPDLKLPLFEYGTSGKIFILFSHFQTIYTTISATFDFIMIQLKSLVTYRDLHSEVLQAFREVGNSIVSVRALEDVMVSLLHGNFKSYCSREKPDFRKYFR